MHTRLNGIYTGIKQRCCNPRCKAFKDYGGRGITICDEWNDKTIIVKDGHFGSKGWFAFKEFALSSGYAEGLSIDRIDNNKGYNPENCRWATAKIQSNNRRSCIILEHNGMKKNMAEWAEYFGMPYRKFKSRVERYGADNLEMIFSDKRAKNKKSEKLIITYKGKTQKLSKWCKELNIDYPKTRARISVLGWSVEKTFETK